jgi:enoyl-CoA hydratase/3-hydroxyacyl-CoA dehydrogenase
MGFDLYPGNYNPLIERPGRPMPKVIAVVGIISKAIEDAARAPTLEEALEVSYEAFGQVACTEAAKEGISAFLEKRRPEFKN